MDSNNLSSLLWLLAIGGLFYWMMRKGGCGGHGGHAHGGGHQYGGHGTSEGTAGPSHDAQGATVRDPVCGMQVDPDRAAGMRTVAGRAFHFCSAECVAKFDRDPEGYARRAGETDPMPPGPHRGHAGR